MKTLIKQIYNRIKLLKINFYNHKFRKYIVKYEEIGDKLKIINSNGNYKYVDNNIPNKVKTMEIIKEHEQDINNRIEYYNSKKDDYKIIIMSSALILITLGFIFGVSFFFGSLPLLLISFISFSILLYLFVLSTYKIFIFREEIKHLEYIKGNKEVFESEIKEIIKDSFIILKDKYYDIVLKIITIIDNIKVKFN